MFFSKYTYYLSSIFTLLWQVSPLPRLVSIFLGRQPAEGKPEEIRLRYSGLRFAVRSAMDIWTIKETLLDHVYEKYGFPIGDDWTVVDVGGGFGDFSVLAAHRHPSNRVIAFEPTTNSYLLLKKNLQLNQLGRVQVYHAAVWSSDSEIRIDTIGDPGQFTSQEHGAAAGAEVVVPGYSLETVMRMTGIEHIDLIKLDCEGAEYEILFKTLDAVLARVKRIVMEYHDNAGPFTHVDMAKFLTEKGYRVKIRQSPVHVYLGYLSATR